MTKFLLVVSGLMISTACFASGESPATPHGDPIVNVFTGTTPYLIVRDTSGQSGEPGLYRKSAAGWTKIVPGPILHDEQGEAVMKQLNLAKIDNRAYAVIMGHGRLYAVTNLTDPANPKSFIEFGSNETPLIEPGTGQKRVLPTKVSNASQVSFHVSDSQTGGNQAIVASIKFDEPTPVGEGVTFAFAVKPMTPGDNSLNLQGPPVVLDYNFHSNEALSRFVSEKPTGEKLVYSQLLIDQTEHLLRNADTETIDQMQSHWPTFLQWMNDKMTSLRDPNFTAQGTSTTIAYDLEKSRVVRNVEYTKAFHTPSTDSFTQKYSPLRGTGQVVVKDYRGADHHVPGFLTMSGDKPLAAHDQMSSVFVVNGELYLVIRDSTVEAPIIKLPFPAHKSIDELTFKLARGTTKNALGRIDYGNFQAIFSAVYTDSYGQKAETTQAIEIKIYSPIVGAAEAPVELYNHFLTQPLLEKRLKVSENGDILFDNATPFTDNLNAYELSADVKAPALNISASSSGTPVYQYTDALKTINFEPGLDLAFFKPVPNVVDPSGLYSDNGQTTGLEKNAIRGQVLVQKEAAENILELPRERFPKSRVGFQKDSFTQGRGEKARAAYVFAIDPHHKNGAEGFIIAVASNLKSKNPEHFSLQYRAAGYYNIDQVRSLRAIRGRGDYKEILYTFVSVDVAGTKGQTFVYTTDLASPALEDTEEPRQLDVPVDVANEALDDAALDSRIVFAESGLPYFIRTPEIPPDSTSYELLDLARFESVKPALRTGKKKIKFARKAEGDGANDEEDWGSYMDARKSWKQYPDEIEKRFGSSDTLIEELNQFEPFRVLGRTLDTMASNSQPNSLQILVVPEKLREVVWQYVGSYYSKSKSGKKGFSKSNDQIAIDIFNRSKAFQDDVFANLDQMTRDEKRRYGAKRHIFLGGMDEIMYIGAPQASNNDTFMLQQVTTRGNTGATGVDTSVQGFIPSILYLLASGKPLSLEEFRKSPRSTHYSGLILATPEEMKMIDQKFPHEADNGLLKRFNVSEINNPDIESMTASISKIFSNEDVKTLDYEFDASDVRKNVRLSESESFKTVIEYAISRFQSLVEQKKLATFESFMRFRSAFATAVLTDRELKRSRKIGKYFVERVLTQVFDIPINLNTLADDDPLKILARKDAALKLQEAGYAGPFDLKMKIIKTILSQTQADAGKPIPSSTILFGETGAGKTFLFKTLMKMLGVKLYDPRANDNTEAGAIIINVGQLIAETPKNQTSEAMTVDDAIAHLNKFLGQPNGFRGYVLIDDAHANSDVVKGKILAWVRSLFESSGGMMKINGINRPVRNVNLFMTLNPTADQDQIAKYAKNKTSPTTEEKLLATLSSDQFKIEPSFLRRWGSIVNLDYMPAGAKGPELINSLGAASREQLTTSGRVALVDPRVVEQIVKQSQYLDARTFLSASISSLMQAINDSNLNGSIAMVIPSGSTTAGSRLSFDTNMSPSENLNTWVQKNTRVISLDGSTEGNLSQLKLIVDAYRIPVYELLVNAIVEDPRFAGDELTQKRLLAPIMMAIHDHIADRGSVPISALQISGVDFGLKTQAERRGFRELIDRMSEGEKPFFPIQFAAPTGVSTWDDFLGQAEQDTSEGRSRRDVLHETMQQLKIVAKAHLNRVMQTDDVESIGNTAQWLNKLKTQEDPAIKQIGKEVANSLWYFMPALFDERLIETQRGLIPINTYVAARLFMYSLDRAIIELPWMRVNRIMLEALHRIAEDQVLSQRPGIQSFLFSNRYRLVKPTTPDLINQIIASSPTYVETPEAFRKRMQTEFESDCEKYLTPLE